MAKTAKETDNAKVILQSMLLLMQDSFIMQALTSGARVDEIRKHLHVDKWRVSKVSKLLNTGKREPK